jgi:hypothetical protein
MQVEHPTVGLGSWRRWMMANFVGFTIGGAIFGAVQRARMQPYFEVVTSGADAARILAANTGVSMTMFGALVGGAQWLALRRRVRAGWWLPATCLGWALSGVIVGALSGVTAGTVSTIGPDVGLLGFVVAAVAGCLVLGLLPGTLQWLVLRRQLDRVGWWPVVSLAGLVVGFGVGFVVVRWGMVSVVSWLRPEDFPSAKALVLVGAVTGTLYGAVSWPALARLRRAAPAAGGAPTEETRPQGQQHRAAP